MNHLHSPYCRHYAGMPYWIPAHAHVGASPDFQLGYLGPSDLQLGPGAIASLREAEAKKTDTILSAVGLALGLAAGVGLVLLLRGGR